MKTKGNYKGEMLNEFQAFIGEKEWNQNINNSSLEIVVKKNYL